MWDLPGPGLEPVSPVLAGRFLTTTPAGKSNYLLSNKHLETVNGGKGIMAGAEVGVMVN